MDISVWPDTFQIKLEDIPRDSKAVTHMTFISANDKYKVARVTGSSDLGYPSSQYEAIAESRYPQPPGEQDFTDTIVYIFSEPLFKGPLFFSL